MFVYFGFDDFGLFQQLNDTKYNNFNLIEKNSDKDLAHFNKFTSVFFPLQDNILVDRHLLKIENIFPGWDELYLLAGGKIFHCGFKNKISFIDPLDCLLPDHSKVQKVVCGWKKIFILTDDGYCFVCYKQNSLKKYFELSKIVNKKIKYIDSGDLFTVFVTHDDHVFQLKDDEISADSIIPISCALHVKRVSCGKEHVLLLTNEGLVYSFGLGSRGQLGHGDIETENKPKVIEALAGVKIKKVVSGGWHSCALSDIGDLYIWGWNESGQLGLPCEKSHNIKIDLESSSHREQTKVVNIQSIPYLMEFFEERIICIGCGSRHTAVVMENGKVFTWGWNAYSQLGFKSAHIVDKPVQVEFAESFFVKNVKCSDWGTLVCDCVSNT